MRPVVVLPKYFLDLEFLVEGFVPCMERSSCVSSLPLGMGSRGVAHATVLFLATTLEFVYYESIK
jgi:hypothetical protein